MFINFSVEIKFGEKMKENFAQLNWCVQLLWLGFKLLILILGYHPIPIPFDDCEPADMS